MADETKLVFHLYDPGYGGVLSVHDTLAEAIAAGDEDIKENHEPDWGEEWNDDVAGIAVFAAPADCADVIEDGQEVARAREVNIQHRPDDTAEDGWSESLGDHWSYGNVDYVCNYQVLPLYQEGGVNGDQVR